MRGSSIVTFGALVAYLAGTALVLTTVVLATHFPFAVLSILCLTALACIGGALGRERRLSVAVLGGTIAPILIPPLHTPLPAQTGMLIGLIWLIGFAQFGNWKPTRSTTFALFLVVAALGILGEVVTGTFSLYSQIMVYVVILGYFAWRLEVAGNDLLLLRGIVVVASIEAIVCIFELLILKGPIFGTTSGLHPVLSGYLRAEGTLGHPLVAGMVMLVGLSLLGTTVQRRATRLTAGAVLLFGIFATGSSSIYITTALCLSMSFLLSGRAFARSIKLIATSALAIYLLFNQVILEPVISDVTGVKATHRINSIVAFPSLLTERPLSEALFGTGWGSQVANYRSGYLLDDNFTAVDNQFVTVMMACGLIGFTIFCAFIIRTMVRAAPSVRTALFGLVFMFLSFDVLMWAASACLFVVLAVGMVGAQSSARSRPEVEPPGQASYDEPLPQPQQPAALTTTTRAL